MEGTYFVRKYRYMILLAGTAIAFAFGFVIAYGLVKISGITTVEAAMSIALTVGGFTGIVGFVCICLAELRRI